MAKKHRKLLLLVLAAMLVFATLTPAALALELKPASTEANASGGIKFDRKKLVLYVGERYDMVSFLQSKAKGGTLNTSGISWKSSKKSVVLIDKKTGVALGMKPGTVTITATTKDKKKATIQLVVKRNKLDKIYGKAPDLSIARRNDYELVLKSVEITSPDTVVAEYYLINNYPSSKVARYFSEFYAKITAYDTYYEETVTIVDGSPVLPVRVNCRGQRVKVFKVTFKYDDVQHTDIALAKSGRSSIDDRWDVYLEF